MTDDLQILFPGKEITAKGETITVVPFFFGAFPRAIKLMQPVAQSLQSSGIIKFAQDGTKVNFVMADGWILKLPQIVSEGGEALIELVAFSIGKPRKWFDTLPGDEGIALTKAVLEVNADFFVRKMAPILGLAPETQSPLIGEQSSQDSLTPSTAEEISTVTH